MTLLALAASFLIGVYLGDRLEVPTAALGLFALAGVLGAVALVVRRRGLLPALMVLALVLGAARIGASPDDATDALLTYHGQRSVELEGTVASDPEATGTALRFRL